jgi:RNA polymerase sigma-70 factor (ECF subfamily)
LVGRIVGDDRTESSEQAVAGVGEETGPAREVDGAVLRRAQRGDHGAFHEIVDHYEGRLRVLAFNLLRDSDQMNDALQDAFVKAWSGLPGFRGDAALRTAKAESPRPRGSQRVARPSSARSPRRNGRRGRRRSA